MIRTLISGLWALFLVGSQGASAASQVVLFNDGRTLTVQRVERQDDMAVLTLEGGGSIAVPASRVTNWWELDDDLPPVTEIAVSSAWRTRAGDYADVIGTAAQRHDLDPTLLTAIAEVESAFDAQALSHKGAQGLLQLMPQTAQRFGVRDAFDASQNVEGGARYLKWLLERYQGSTELALAGYNAGEAAVDRYQGIPPYRETENYVNRVMASVDRLLAEPPGSPVAPAAQHARRNSR